MFMHFPCFFFSKNSRNLHTLSVWILATTATTGGDVLFSSQCLFLHRECKILANIGYFVTNLRTFWCPFYRPKQCGGVPKLTNIRLPPNIFWSLPLYVHGMLKIWTRTHSIHRDYMRTNIHGMLQIWMIAFCVMCVGRRKLDIVMFRGRLYGKNNLV